MYLVLFTIFGFAMTPNELLKFVQSIYSSDKNSWMLIFEHNNYLSKLEYVNYSNKIWIFSKL